VCSLQNCKISWIRPTAMISHLICVTIKRKYMRTTTTHLNCCKHYIFDTSANSEISQRSPTNRNSCSLYIHHSVYTADSISTRRAGRLLPGGEPDLACAATCLINDWQRGKIPYFVAPPLAPGETPRSVAKEPNQRIVIGTNGKVSGTNC
jgi:ribosome biogenesis GTPase A